MINETDITKEQALAVFESVTALAAALGITKGAVSQWKDGEPIPRVHALRLRYEIAPAAFEVAS